MVGGDATLQPFGAVDWNNKRFMVEETSQFAEALTGLVESSDQVEIIAVMEFLAFLVFASQEGASWVGCLVFYVTDNQNVATWLRKRRPRGRVARRLMLLLQRLEAECGFTSYPTYIRTYRNELADWVSRADLDEVRAKLATQGWSEVSFEGDWRQIVEDARCGPLVLPTGDVLERTAQQIACRPFSPSPVPSRVWLDTTWEVVCQGPVSFASAALALAKHGLEPAAGSDRVWASLSQDPHGAEWQRVVERLTSGPCKIVAVDCPRQTDTAPILEFLRKKNFSCTLLSLRTSDLGSFSARRRSLVVGSCGFSLSEMQGLGQKRCPSPAALNMIPLNQNPSSDSRVKGTVVLEPTIMTTGDSWLPHPAGHVLVAGAKELVHHVTGPACAFVGVEHSLKGVAGTRQFCASA